MRAAEALIEDGFPGHWARFGPAAFSQRVSFIPEAERHLVALDKDGPLSRCVNSASQM